MKILSKFKKYDYKIENRINKRFWIN